MLWINGGRSNGKTYLVICERISELDLQIEFAKRHKLSYKHLEIERTNLLSKIERNNYGKTDAKKAKNKK